MIAVVVAGYRGDLYIPGCLDSIDRWVPSDFVRWKRVIHDDAHAGMAANVQAGFDWALSTDAEFVFWVEEDFRFFQPVPMAAMVALLRAHKHLAQIVLKRNPWSAEEKAAGGQIEVSPDEYTQQFGHVEHRRLFSLNPSLIRREVLELGWPAGPIGIGNESGFTARCLDAGYSFAYYGRKDAPPLCEHVGHIRGSGYTL